MSKHLGALALIATLLVPAIAAAQPAKPCQADAARLCAGIKPGGGRIWRCMKAKEAQLSAACKARIAQTRAELKDAQQACAADVQQHCAGIVPGAGRIVACLLGAEDKLTEGCRAKVAAGKARAAAGRKDRREAFRAFNKACGADIRTHCKGVPAGGGRILSCLKGAKAKLTPACQAALP